MLAAWHFRDSAQSVRPRGTLHATGLESQRYEDIGRCGGGRQLDSGATHRGCSGGTAYLWLFRLLLPSLSGSLIESYGRLR